MEPGESLRKAFRRFIPVPKCNFDHFIIRLLQIQRRLVQPSVPDIFSDTVSGHQRESLLKKERRKIHPIRHILRTDVISQVLFHIIDCCTNAGKPLHRRILRPLIGSLYLSKRKSSCHFLLGSVLPRSQRKAGPSPLCLPVK